MYAHVAIHAPAEAKRDDALKILNAVGETVLTDAPGLITIFEGEERGTGRLFAMTVWEKQSDFDAVLPAIMDAIGKTEIHSWATRPAEVIRFLELPADQ